ncbi:MAG: DUF692 family protein [Clostridia bacterium]|nr:DUF692 family protein [Clostridia bacterium]
MKLAVNYLQEVQELLEEGKINFIDYLKLYSINGDLSPFDWCTNHSNVLFHGLVGHGSDVASEKFWENRDVVLQKEYYQKGKTPYISLHINTNDKELKSEEETLKIIIENVEKIKEVFGMEVILENVPARYDNRSKDFLSSPEFITKVVNELDCGFLFDIGHARAAADVLEIPFDEYVNRLPMNRLVEVHLSGVSVAEDGKVWPLHGKMNEEDYIFLEEAIKKYDTLQIVTLEYGAWALDEGNCDYPIPKYGIVNEEIKTEVYEQLMRIKEIMNK